MGVMGQETSEVASFCGQATTLLEQKLSGLQVALEKNLVVALLVGNPGRTGYDDATAAPTQHELLPTWKRGERKQRTMKWLSF
jgi:hypothetical protein